MLELVEHTGEVRLGWSGELAPDPPTNANANAAVQPSSRPKLPRKGVFCRTLLRCTDGRGAQPPPCGLST